MKIFSYNVNGIRAAMSKGFTQWLKAAAPDVICLQEIKALESQIDLSALEEIGYTYHYFHSAEKKGYSGVAILSKTAPTQVEVGAGIDYMDREGRILRADYGDLSIMSLYLPSGTNIDRLDHKLQFMADFQNYINELKKTGFLPVERKWLDDFLKSGFIDSFRFFHKEPHNYSWWSYRANARANNKGWRIDYCLVAQPLENRLLRAAILPEAKHSDHCPILVEIQ